MATPNADRRPERNADRAASRSLGRGTLPEDHFDYSTAEAENAVRAASALVLEIRDEVTGPLARKVALYEKTLGLAVAPVLLRRAILRFLERRGRRRVNSR